MQQLGTGQVGAEKANRLPDALPITGQSVLDQRDGQVADSTFKLITRAADGQTVSSRWRSTIGSGTLSRLVIGVTPGDLAVLRNGPDGSQAELPLRTGMAAVFVLVLAVAVYPVIHSGGWRRPRTAKQLTY